jgi:hypothetical protein
MWTERTGLTRWTTAAISPSKTRSWSGLPTADRQKRQQRLLRDVALESTPIEYGASIVDGLFVKEQTLRLSSINRAHNVAGFTGVGGAALSCRTRSKPLECTRTAATGRMLLPSHTCLRTSNIVGTNRRGESLGRDIRGGEFRILDWMGSGSGPLPRRHCGKGQRRFRSAVHRSYSYQKAAEGALPS